jgi:hypothetical protein
MHANYPRMVDSPTEKDPGRQIKVLTEDDHKRVFPEDYDRFQAELKGDPTGGRGVFDAAASAAQERERCAVVAETYPKGGKLGAAIASAIRSQMQDLGRYPKVLRNPETSPVKGGDFTAAGPRPDTFLRHDITVEDPAEEAAARADGFTLVISQASLPGTSPSAADKEKALAANQAADASFPKVLRDPSVLEKPDATHTEVRDGKYARADITVTNPVQEAAAREHGYTEVVGKAKS